MSGDSYMPDASVEIEPTQRWVRVKFDGATVADSKKVMMLREAGHLPVYFFPRTDVKMDMLAPAGQTNNTAFYDLNGSRKSATRAAYSYPENNQARTALRDHIAFRWGEMDHWYEEDEEIFVHPRDPYKRIDAIPSSRHVVVKINGVTVADTRNLHLLFETRLPTRYYIPQADVDMSLLTPSDTSTRCPYKGIAKYWHVTVNGETLNDIVWSYPDPIPECPKIEGLLCFFNEKVDIYVDGEQQDRPQTPWS